MTAKMSNEAKRIKKLIHNLKREHKSQLNKAGKKINQLEAQLVKSRDNYRELQKIRDRLYAKLSKEKRKNETHKLTLKAISSSLILEDDNSCQTNQTNQTDSGYAQNAAKS